MKKDFQSLKEVFVDLKSHAVNFEGSETGHQAARLK